MKLTVKKIMAMMIAGLMLFVTVPLNANAATQDIFTYEVSNGQATIVKCDNTAKGELIIPDTLGGFPVTRIGKEAFTYCGVLTSITVPASVKSIEDGAFQAPYYLKSIYVNAGNAAYASENGVLFNKSKTALIQYPICKTGSSYTIPNSVISIGDAAFYLTDLKSVTISNRLKRIGNRAFNSCSALKNITIPNSVTSIGDEAFKYCTALENITIPNSVTNIGDRAFIFCSALKNVILSESLKSIGDAAFYLCSDLKSITVPNSVKRIGNEAFWGCSALKNITIPNCVTNIGDDAFDNITGLTRINVSKANKVYTSENGVLYNKSKTVLLKYPCGKTASSYIIPNSVKSIGIGAFYNCTCFKNISIPESVTNIGNGAFGGCRGLTNITIPNSVKSIGGGAFYDCKKLKSITIPDSLTSIGYSAFFETAWYDNQPDGLIYAGKVAYYYKGNVPNNTTIVLKPGTKGIAGGAFWDESNDTGCTNLTGISIPNSVMNIGEQAFFGDTGLESVTIPKSVVSIGEQAFGFYVEGDYTTKFPGLTISCFANSTGLRYAKDNGFKYKILPASAAATDTTAAVTDTTAATKNVTTTINGSAGTTAASTAASNGISNRVTVPAVILTMVVLLAVAVTAVIITAKKKKKKT